MQRLNFFIVVTEVQGESGWWNCSQVIIFLEVDGMRGLFSPGPSLHVHINLFVYYSRYLFIV